MKTEAERQLAALVAMPTITADIAANDMALDYLEHYFTAHGMYCRRHRFQGHGALTASTSARNHKQPTVLLSAHVDVVSGTEAQFTLRENDGKLYGRGAYDMKFAIASYMQVIKDMAEAGSLAQHDFGIMITADEEAAKGELSVAGHLIRAGYRPEVCLLPDSTAPGWDIEKSSKGWWRFDLIATGKTVHSARPWEGESASMKLIHALHELKEHFKNHSPTTDTLNIGSIHGGEVYNLVPDHMLAKVEIRVVAEESLTTYKSLIKTLCAKHELTYETFNVAPPVYPILDHPLVDTYKDVVQELTGRRPEGYISLGGSDAPYFTDAGVPCILSCPNGGGHHSEHEWISRKSFLQFAPMLHTYLEKTAKQPATATTRPRTKKQLVTA